MKFAKSFSDGPTLLRKFKHCEHLLTRDPREPLQKIVDCCACLEILEGLNEPAPWQC
jgi:hypothetical protein